MAAAVYELLLQLYTDDAAASIIYDDDEYTRMMIIRINVYMHDYPAVAYRPAGGSSIIHIAATRRWVDVVDRRQIILISFANDAIIAA